MTDPLSLAIIALAFGCGGLVKGAAGLGLPLVAVSSLTFVFGLQNAIILMIVPALVSNAMQGISGPETRIILKRLGPFLVPSLCTIWFGTGLLVTMDNSWLVAMLGVILVFYAVTSISGFTLSIPRDKEWWIGPLFGAINGVTNGISGVISTPSVIYINGLNLSREQFVQALGLLFLISYIVLTAALYGRGLINLEVGALSFFAAVPTVIGMWVGRKFRLKTSEASFKWLFYRVLLLIGIYMVVRALLF